MTLSVKFESLSFKSCLPRMNLFMKNNQTKFKPVGIRIKSRLENYDINLDVIASVEILSKPLLLNLENTKMWDKHPLITFC